MPNGSAVFFLHQIGQQVVMGEAEIEQNGFAGWAEHDVARLDVEMDDVLAVQIVQRLGYFHADLRHFGIMQRKFCEPRV